MELANLIQELLKKGWKVYGVFDKLMTFGQDWGKKTFGFGVLGEVRFSLRELVSKESGLWQFVCENELIKGNTREAYYWQYKNPLGAEWSKTYRKAHYQHRIIESALKDESELEKFLLDNIKI